TRLAFSPDGRTLAVGAYQPGSGKGEWTGGVELLDAETGRRTAVLQHARPRAVLALAYSPDGKTLAAVEVWREGKETRQGVTLWDVAGARVRAALPEERVNYLAWSPDGKVLARGVYWIKDRIKDRELVPEVRRWDVAAGRELPALTNPGSKNLVGAL